MQKFAKISILAVALFGIGFVVGQRTKPGPVQITSEQQTQQNNIRTITKTIKRPDGVQETVTERIDTSKVQTAKSEVKIVPKNWLAGAGVQASLNSLSQPSYMAHLGYRVFGPVYITGTVTSTGYVGASAIITF